jgi:signal transduction histidine kinase/CheY-like chemotaxis protein
MSASSFAPVAEPQGDTFPVGELLSALRALARGELAVPLLAERGGSAGEVVRELNRVIELQRQLALDRDSKRAEPPREQPALAAGSPALEEVEPPGVAAISRYRSQFLANMSHELRTPLNSLLILSKMLLDNVDGNLSDKQLAFCQTIHASGNELLARINDILDLAKIEAGTLVLESSQLVLEDLQAHIEQTFRHVAREKGLEFTLEVRRDLPPTLFTDAKRLQQILKHLLSNAFKFTPRGRVSLSVAPAHQGWAHDHAQLKGADVVFAFSVTDTGTGIPEDEQGTLFDAFARLAGPPHRRSGGTGLGLALSREVATLLGGELRVVSELGKGSTFTCYLPSRRMLQPEGVLRALLQTPRAQRPASSAPGADTLNEVNVADPSAQAAPAERLILIAESAAPLSQALHAAARQNGIEAVARVEPGVDFAVITRLRPVGILLDVRAGDLAGWIMLERLGQDPSTRHVPVVTIADDAQCRRALHMGAVSCIGTTTQRDIERAAEDIRFWSPGDERRLLVADWTLGEPGRLGTLLGVEGVEVRSVSSLAEASSQLRAQRFHAVVLALGSGAAGLPLLLLLSNLARGIPMVLYAERALEPEEAALASTLGEASPLSSVSDLDQLSIEVCKRLRRAPATVSSTERRLVGTAGAHAGVLSGARVLIIDADVRNIFAMTSTLERHGAVVSHADSGREGLELLEQGPPVQALIVDVATSELGGHDIIRRVRRQALHAALPILAITAKGTPIDRDACARSGATHCIPRPVDAQHLVSALRVIIAR